MCWSIIFFIGVSPFIAEYTRERHINPSFIGLLDECNSTRRMNVDGTGFLCLT
jgi:hypothetical protein